MIKENAGVVEYFNKEIQIIKNKGDIKNDKKCKQFKL